MNVFKNLKCYIEISYYNCGIFIFIVQVPDAPSCLLGGVLRMIFGRMMWNSKSEAWHVGESTGSGMDTLEFEF